MFAPQKNIMLYSDTFLCYCSRHTAGAEVAVEPNPVGPDSSEATSSRPNPVHGGPATYETGPATTTSPTNEYVDVISNPTVD